MARYLVSTFTLSMLELPMVGESRELRLYVTGLGVDEFCKEVARVDVINALGHQGTADLVNSLCNTNLKMNRIEVRLRSGDVLILLQLTIRPPEGRVYSREEMLQLYYEGKVRFFKVEVT